MATISKDVEALLRCPVCKAKLRECGACFRCVQCGSDFPRPDDVPVLINENASLFSIADYTEHRPAASGPNEHPGLARTVANLLPGLTRNVNQGKSYREFAEALMTRSPHPLVLVIGGRVVGSGMGTLLQIPGITLVETDICFGPRTAIVCDAHDLPFADACFDGVIAQAVLEHVLDPQRCAAEIERVLKPGGLVYAETPFMQQVHAGAYDFTRFTYLGHRRLFRKFDEVQGGIVCGPGMALGWSWEYFLTSFAESRTWRCVAKAVARLTAFPFKYFDGYLSKKRGAMDGASGFYFIGQKNGHLFSDRDLVKSYPGLNHVV